MRQLDLSLVLLLLEHAPIWAWKTYVSTSVMLRDSATFNAIWSDLDHHQQSTDPVFQPFYLFFVQSSQKRRSKTSTIEA